MSTRFSAAGSVGAGWKWIPLRLFGQLGVSVPCAATGNAVHVATAWKNSLVVDVSLEGERVSLCSAEQGGWGAATERFSVCCSFGGPCLRSIQLALAALGQDRWDRCSDISRGQKP